MKDSKSLSIFLDRLAEYIAYSLTVLIFVAAACSLGQVFTSFEKHSVGEGQLLFRICALIVCLTPLFTIFTQIRRRHFTIVTRRWALLRLFVYISLGALIATSLAFSRNRPEGYFPMSAFALSAFLVGGGIWILAACFWERVSKLWENKLFRTCESVLAEFIVICLSVELILSVIASHTSSPLFVKEGEMDSILKHLRPPAGTKRYDIRINSRGYFDDEFFAAGDNDLVIACLADSFGYGIVPHLNNFTTVAERKLAQSLSGRYRRIDVQNFGVPMIGLPEYTYIFEKEAQFYRPRIVIVCIFPGPPAQGSRSLNPQTVVRPLPSSVKSPCPRIRIIRMPAGTSATRNSYRWAIPFSFMT